MPTIARALLSCHDKRGLIELARFLSDRDVELVSTAGTLEALRGADIPAISIADFTGVPEMLGGRLKTLHPKVHAGLLGVRDDKLHQEQMEAHQYPWLDLVVANLHPVLAALAQPGVTTDEIIEQIDIGGSAMIRSAAKNFRYVTVVVNPRRYSALMHAMQAHDGAVPYAQRFTLAQEAFELTARYDQTIAAFMREHQPPEE